MNSKKKTVKGSDRLKQTSRSSLAGTRHPRKKRGKKYSKKRHEKKPAGDIPKKCKKGDNSN